ncbi:MAG: DNA N-6-adenine-methyltransferase [Dehalococcoidales bacterium]
MMSDTWLTPVAIIGQLGSFDLDPCAAISQPWATAKKHYTITDDGLAQEWKGRVWLNPPYSREAVIWLRRLSQHGNGIALMFARTETKWFWETVWESSTASAIMFLRNRLYFYKANGNRAKANAGAPSVLVAYGYSNAKVLENSLIDGYFVSLERKANGRI